MDYAALFADVSEAATAPRGAPLHAVTSSLSDEQAIALSAPFDRSAVVVAGAGAGKTFLLVERATALIKAGADPSRVAVVTFTRKAATELKTRLRTRIGDKDKVPVCGTVHSLALSRLASQCENVTITNDDEVMYFIDLLREEIPEDLLDLTDAELLLAICRAREEEKTNTTMGILASRFEELLAKEQVVDFTALLKMGVDKVRATFDHVLVDESQDLSSLQQTFLKKIGRKNCRYWYVGDGDQSIYAFRGAHGTVMNELRAQCEDQYVLSINFRSGMNIVAHANNVISVNPGRLEIEWKANRTDRGEVTVEFYATAEEELQAVREWLSQAPTTRAALARTQALIAPLRDEGLQVFSVHETKGLEWPEVWVMGCEASLFPHPLGFKEEERRLFYVAMTRARDYLKMSYCGTRTVRKKTAVERAPSGFIFEAHGL